MEIPLRRNGPGRVIETTLPNGYSIKHTPERNLPGGGNWVVQKFGGTSIGKFAVSIAEDIVLAGSKERRVAIVCSARSTKTKSEGTTNRLLRAARDTLEPDSQKYVELVEAIRADHIAAGQEAIRDQELLKAYIVDVDLVCHKLVKILEAAQYLRAVTNQTSDMVISVGEKLSCLYMTALLQDRGANAVYVDLSEIITFPVKIIDEHFYKNLSLAIADRIKKLADDAIPVITGYFGNVPGGLLENIGRGYTDLCAALAAVGLNAAELQIWKEVDGIFTADPRKVHTAKLVDSVTPAEAAELTFYGSEVIHPFTMDQVIKASIPIRIKNVMNPRGRGTMIMPETPADALARLRKPVFLRNRSVSNLTALGYPKRPTAVTVKPGITVLNVHSKKRTRAHGFLMNIFSILDKHGLSVDLISSSEVHVSMALHSEISMLSGQGEEELKIASEALAAAVDDLSKWGEVDVVGGMCIISLVGRQLNSMVGISGRFFSTLGENGINIEMISQGASEINISCVIEEKDANFALSVVHTNLFNFLD